MDTETDCSVLIDRIRTQCVHKGLRGIKGLACLFRGLDKDYNKTISCREFEEGMKIYGIDLTKQQLRLVFHHFDKDGSDNIDFREFLTELQPSLPDCRRDVINEAFNKLDVIRDDVINLDDLRIVYADNAKRHPKYISGEWTIDDVLRSFIESFDDPQSRDGAISREEFMNYYAGVSATVDDDAYFDLMMRSCWGLPPRGSSKSK